MTDGQREYKIVTFPDAVASGGFVSYSHLSGDRFYVGATTVTVTATDSCDNRATCSFIIEVRPASKYM